MNVGDRPIIAGLLYFDLITLTLVLYLLLLLGAFFAIAFFINQLRTNWRYDAWDAMIKLFAERRIAKALTLFSIFNLAIYLHH